MGAGSLQATEEVGQPYNQAKQVTASKIIQAGKTKFALDVFIKGGDITVQVNETVTLAEDEEAVNIPEQVILAPGDTGDVLTYEVPADKDFYLMLAEGSIDNVAETRVFIDNELQGVKRTYWSEFNWTMDFSRGYFGLKVPAGKTIRIEGVNERPYAARFNSRLFGILKAQPTA